ncbi:MAG: DNA repair protein RadC [Flavobacteriales bacterium]|nr:DNA repair protein RadC [Flavobacteriales bacterium]
MPSNFITNITCDEQPREKLLSKGKETLTHAELLGILISTGTRSKTATDLAKEILKLGKNDLNEIARFGINDYKKVNGIGEAKALTLIAAIELGSRRKLNEAVKNKILSSVNASEILIPIVADKLYEEFWILNLNRANALISFRQISEGGITGTVVDIRRIFKLALEENATSIILAHNHPSGNLSPSEADKNLTRKVKNAGEIMDIPVRDHLIISSNGYFSFADEGLM